MMNLKDAASYALEQLQKAGADDAAVIVTSGKIDELNIDGGEFSLMRSALRADFPSRRSRSRKPAIFTPIPAKRKPWTPR